MANKHACSSDRRVILEFRNATVIVWPDLDRLAIVSPFGDSSMSIEECLAELKKPRKIRRRNARCVDKNL
jgi:hypothetical protein